MRESRSPTAIAARTLVAPILWGTTYVVISEVLPYGRPLLAAAWRVAPAGLVLVVIGLLGSRWRPRADEWWRTAVLALFNFGIFFPLLILSAGRLPGGVAAAAGGLQPLLVALLTAALSRTAPRTLDLAVGAAAALGVALVVVRPGAGYDEVGLLAALGGQLSFATGVVLTRRFPRPGSPLGATGWQLAFSAVVLVPVALLVEGAPPALTWDALAGFGYLSLIGTALAFVLWFNGIRQLPSQAPPLLGLAAPVTGALFGWLTLHQTLSAVQLAGFAITIAAIGYGATVGARPAAAQRVPSGELVTQRC